MGHVPPRSEAESGLGVGAAELPGSRPEAALVRAAQDGDRAALEQLLVDCLPLLHRIVARALDGHADTDDLVQEAMLRIVRGLPRLREPDRFRSWAVAIAYRQIQQHLRHRRRGLRLGLGEPLPERAADEPADPRADFAERSVAELVLAAQRRDLVRAARWLEQDDRRLLALWWEETAGVLGRSELAAAMGLPRGHVAVRVQRMKEQLQTARLIVSALSAGPRCPGLAAATRGWDGEPGSLWRKRLGRHVRDCPACRAPEAGLVPPERLLPGIAVLPVPAALLTGLAALLAEAGAAKSTAGAALTLVSETVRSPGPKVLAGAAAATAVLLGALLLPWSRPAEPDPPPRAAPSAAPAVTGSASRPSPAGDGELFVAPDGSDERGDGSLARPYATLGKAVGLVRPGQTVFLRGGTYRPADPVTIDTDGTAEEPITLAAYRGEHPVLDVSAITGGKWAVTQRADHWTVRGLEVRGSRSHAWVCSGCAHGVFDRLTMHHNAESGLTLRDAGTVGNTVVDSDFHHNRETGGGGSGLAIVFGSGGGNTVRHCRTWDNGGDGVDLGGFTGAVLLDGNWSYRNGNGFTFGGGRTRAAVPHTARNNAAWDNSGYGFNDEGNTGRLTLVRNTAYRNGLAGFRITDSAGSLVANAAWSDGRETSPGPSVHSSGNTWDTSRPPAASSLLSRDPREAEGPRPSNGSLPRTSFLRPRDASVTLGAPMTVTGR